MLSAVAAHHAVADSSGTGSPLLTETQEVARAFIDTVSGPLRAAAESRNLIFAARYLFGDIGRLSAGEFGGFARQAGGSASVLTPDRWSEPLEFTERLFSKGLHFLDILSPTREIPIALEAAGTRPLRYLVVGTNVGGELHAVFDFDSRVLFGARPFFQCLPGGWNIMNRPLADLDRAGPVW